MKKETRVMKERKIRDRYAFITRGKDEALKSLISIGKQMGAFRYVMMAFLFVFLLVYHVSYNLMIQLKLREKMARAVAYVMVVVMLLTTVNLTAFATDVLTNQQDPYAVQTTAVSGGYETLTINSSSLNGNAVWGLGESYSTAIALDNAAAFYAKSSNRNGGTGGFPTNGSITIGSVPYKLGWKGSNAYDGNDCIRLVGSGSQTMSLNTYGAYDDIYVLGTAGGPGEGYYAGFTVTLIYTDGSEENTTYKMYDWYDTTTVTNVTKVGGWYRYEGSSVGYTGSAPTPVLQSAKIDADPTKLLKAITFTLDGCYTSAGNSASKTAYCGVFAVTGKVSGDAPDAPSLLAIDETEDVTATSFVARWDEISNANGYYIDVATDANFTNMLSDYNNKKIEGNDVTSATVTGLTKDVTYYYRVRSYNNSGQSLSSTYQSVTPHFTPLPAPELLYKNTVTVGEETFWQAVSWEPVDEAESYDWKVEILDKEGAVVDSYSGSDVDTTPNEYAYVINDTAGETGKFWLNITNLIDSESTYKVTVCAKPKENSDIYIPSTDLAVQNAAEIIEISYPEVTIDITDELKESGIVSGIGGDCEKTVTNGIVTMTAKNANAYSEFGTWYCNEEKLDIGVSTTITADTSYDTYKLVFGINEEKVDLIKGGNGKYTLVVKDNLVLEQDLVFEKNITIDLNGNTITAGEDAGFVADNSILTLEDGKISDATKGADDIISTVGNGAVVIKNDADFKGNVGGEAEVTWKENNGSVYYATLNDALAENGEKEAEGGSKLTMLQDYSVEGSLTIPEDIELTVPADLQLSVGPEATLNNEGKLITEGAVQNEGTIGVSSGAEWENSGNILNKGVINGDGAIANENGHIDTMEGAVQVPVDNGVKGEVVSEVTWKEGVNLYYGSMEDAMQAAGGTDKEVTVTLQNNYTVQEDLTVPENVTIFIPTDVTLTVPENTTLDNNGQIIESGKLNVEGNLGADASWTDGNTMHYGSLEDALDQAKEDETITLLKDKTWESNDPLVVPEDVTLVVPEDVVLKVDEDKVQNADNIKAETSWKDQEGEDADKTLSFGSLKDAMDAATNTDENVNVTLREDITLDENIEIPSNAVLEIPKDASLTVPENVELENNGNIEAEGDLNIEGDFITEAGWSDGKKDYYGSFSDAMDAIEDENMDVKNVTIMGDVELEEDVEIPDETVLIIDKNASLTVPSDKTLTNNGNIENNGTIINDGNISNNSDILNSGLLDGDGSIVNEEDSVIDSNDGIIKNPIMDSEGNEVLDQVESEVTWETDSDTFYGGLESALQAAKPGEVITLNGNITITEDIVIPYGVTLVVPDGVELNVLPGVIIENKGTLTNEGTITSPVKWQSGGSTYYGTLEDALANTSEGDEITLLKDVTLQENAEVPEGVTLFVPDDVKLTVPAGKELVNKGNIAGEGELVNNGGELDLKEGVASTQITNNGGVTTSEATWTIDGKTYHGSLSEGLAVVNNAGGSIEIETPLLVVDENVEIPENVTLVVPENTLVMVPNGVVIDNNGRIESNGTIMTEGTGKVDTEASWTDETGKTSYGTLTEALEAMSPSDGSESNVTNVTVLGQTVTLPDSVTIPEGVEFEIAEDASLVIPVDKTLTNEGNVLVNGSIIGDGAIDNTNGEISNEAMLQTSGGNVYYGSLESLLSQAGPNDTITLEEDVELDANAEVKDDVTLVIPEDITLTIPAGKELTNNGTIENSEEIHVEGGAFINKGSVEGTGVLSNTNNGLVDLTDGVTENQVFTSGATTKTEAKWMIGEITYQGSLEEALKVAESAVDEDGNPLNVIIQITGKPVVIDENTTIPENVKVDIKTGSSLIVQEGVTLDNQGLIENNGKFINMGTVGGSGELSNKPGSVIDTTEGTVNGPVVNEEGATVKSEVTWTDAEGNTYFGSLEAGLGAVDTQTGGELLVNTDELKIDQDVTIPNGVTLVVPENTTVTIKENVTLNNDGNITSEGTIEIEDGGKLDTDASWTDSNGNKTYGTIEEALEALHPSDGSTSDVTNITIMGDAVTLPGTSGSSTTTIIPDGVEFEVEKGANLIIPEDVELENRGDFVINGSVSGAGAIDNANGTINLEQGSIKTDFVEDGMGTLKDAVSIETENGETYIGSLSSAVEDPTAKEVTILGNTTLKENVEIPEGVTVVVPENVTLTVPSDKELINNGNVSVSGNGKVEITNGGTVTNKGDMVGEGSIVNNGGRLDLSEGVASTQITTNSGTTKSEASWTIDGVTYHGSLAEGLAAVENASGGSISVEADNLVIEENITIPENVTLKVPEGSKVTVANGATLNNDGKIECEGKIETTGTGKVDTQASWTDNTGKTTYGTLQEALEEMNPADGSESNVTKVTIMDNVTLPSDSSSNGEIVIPDGVEFEIADDVTLTIPEDVKLSNNGIISNDGAIVNNGELYNNGYVDCESGVISGDTINNGANGSTTNMVVWETEDNQKYYTSISNALENAQDGDTVTLEKDTVIDKDVQIPADVELVIPEGVTLTVPEGSTLTNNGAIVNEGAIANEGTIDNENGDTLGGQITGEGEVSSEVKWTKDGETYYGPIEEAVDDVKTSGGTIVVNAENVVIDSDVIIPSNVTLEVPEGTKVTVGEGNSLVNNGTVQNNGEICNDGNIIGTGTLNNEGGKIESTNGTISNTIQNGENGKFHTEASWEINGKTYYGSLKSAIEATKSQLNSTIYINNNITITEDIVIPNGVVVEIKEGVYVIIDENGSLTNKGTIINNGTICTEGDFVDEGKLKGDGTITDEAPPQDDDPNPDKPNDGSDDDSNEDSNVVPENPSVEIPGTGGSNNAGAPVKRPNRPQNNTGAVENPETEVESDTETDTETDTDNNISKYEDKKDENVAGDIIVQYGTGTISIEIETLNQKGEFNETMYKSVILSDLKTVINACLTEEEKALVENGADLQVRLKIQLLTKEISKEDKQLIEDTLLEMKRENSGLEIAGYLDVTIEKRLSEQEWKKMVELNEEIEITFEIPEEMYLDGVTYSVLRLHNGETTLLEDLDDEEDTITIRTKLFSTYTVLYEKDTVQTDFSWIIWIVILLVGAFVVRHVINPKRKDAYIK